MSLLALSGNHGITLPSPIVVPKLISTVCMFCGSVLGGQFRQYRFTLQFYQHRHCIYDDNFDDDNFNDNFVDNFDDNFADNFDDNSDDNSDDNFGSCRCFL